SAWLAASPRRAIWTPAQARLETVCEQRRHAAAARHAVPLVAQAAGEQAQGEARRGRFGNRAIRRGMEARAPVAGGEHAVPVATRLAGVTAGREGPLLRAVAFEQLVVEPADIEVAADGERAVLVEQRRRRGGLEQWRGARGGEARFEPACDLARDPPVRLR